MFFSCWLKWYFSSHLNPVVLSDVEKNCEERRWRTDLCSLYLTPNQSLKIKRFKINQSSLRKSSSSKRDLYPGFIFLYVLCTVPSREHAEQALRPVQVSPLRRRMVSLKRNQILGLNGTHNEPLIGGAHVFSACLCNQAARSCEIFEAGPWGDLLAGAPVQSDLSLRSAQPRWRVGEAFPWCALVHRNPPESAQTSWIRAICSTVEFCSSISALVTMHLWEGGWLIFQQEEGREE